jgi:HAD superfamily hydrolase (TIGR01509 family)
LLQLAIEWVGDDRSALYVRFVQQNGAVIFDVDGTLVDSNDAHAAAWRDVLGAFGFKCDFGDIRRLIGMGGDKLLPALTGISADGELGRRIVEQRARRFRDAYFDQLRPFPEARALLTRIARDGFRLGIASSAKKDELDRLLEIAGVDDLIDRQTSSDDVDASKPDPDAVHAALAKLRVPADVAVMVGDTPYDIEAAARAGIPTIAVRCGGWADADLRGARAIYDGPADMLARYAPDMFVRAHAGASAGAGAGA